MAENSKRISNRPLKRTSSSISVSDREDSKKVRPCGKADCIIAEPDCCLQLGDNCTRNGYTSRWYHMSLGEHFCNSCFDNLYRPGRSGNSQFSAWSNKWGDVVRASRPNLKRYVANELLPYWVKCVNKKCGKWRMIKKSNAIDSDFIKNFKCHNTSNDITCNSPEDEAVSLVSNPYFMHQLTEIPHLDDSPAGPYLKRFLPQDIGLNPLKCNASLLEKVEDIEPFSVNQCGEACIWPKPCTLDEEEKQFADNSTIPFATYLGVRNLIVALWNLSPKQWLDVYKINIYLICRGLVRIYLYSLAELMLESLTKKSVVNYGIINNPSLIALQNPEPSVLVIGAGISGLAAAKHLYNLGISVTVFEAESFIGGRASKVDDSLAFQTYVVQGILNNPFKILAIQANQEYQKFDGSSVIFDSKGKVISDEIEREVQHLVRGLAQGALERTSQFKTDSNWYDTLIKNFIQFTKSSYLPFLDEKLFMHVLDLFELELGVDFRDLSLLNWESVLSLKGDNVFFPKGINAIIEKLSENLNIIYDAEVKKIDYTSDKVKITSSKGEHTFSKVLLTVPLPVLQSGSITFIPQLPTYKVQTFKNLGDYKCAKLVMQFHNKFWINQSQKHFSQFSIVSDDRLFSSFLDVTPNDKKSTPTLVALISTRAYDTLKGYSDENILGMCTKLLKETFSPKKRLPLPSKWLLIGFNDCNFYGSYLKVGSDPTAFDDMAKSVENKLYFAGDSTFRNAPGCLTGAYLSGLREATKLAEHL